MTKSSLRWAGLAAVVVLSFPVHADSWWERIKGILNEPAGQAAVDMANGSVQELSQGEVVAALKETLTRGTDAAVAQLGRKDGFFGDAALRIPLPPSLQKIESGLRGLGMGAQADELVMAMNRAAEAAVPEARALLATAVKEMTLTDAKDILTGGQTAATDYFRARTEGSLTERFAPIVTGYVEKSGLAQQYNRYAGTAAQFGLIEQHQAAVEDYVTRETLDRLYTVIGEQEAALRADPARAGSELLRKVFAAATGS